MAITSVMAAAASLLPFLIPEITKLTGSKEERLPEFLTPLAKQGMLREVNGKYELVK